MPKKIALEEMSPTAQRIHDAQFKALVATQEAEPNPPLDLAKDTLKTRRLALGLRSTMVASHLKIAESSLRNYESGAQEPGLKVELWQQLMVLYRVTTEELFQLIANTKAQTTKAPQAGKPEAK
jgi:hypothetical protein